MTAWTHAYGEHPQYTIKDWAYQVANGDTRLSYVDWVNHQLEAEVHAKPEQ
jgi:hypothetical protein